MLQRTCYKLKSYLLLQLLIVISLIILLIFIAKNYIDSSLMPKIKEQRQLIGLRKLKNIFQLAQSKSISLEKKVYLCPTINQKTCSNRWDAGVMIFTMEDLNNSEIQILYYNNSSMFTDPLLRMKFFGGNQYIQKLTFLPNGMLINNGNFCIYNNKLYKSFCLYFNQAGKVYIKSKKL